MRKEIIENKNRFEYADKLPNYLRINIYKVYISILDWPKWRK